MALIDTDIPQTSTVGESNGFLTTAPVGSCQGLLDLSTTAVVILYASGSMMDLYVA